MIAIVDCNSFYLPAIFHLPVITFWQALGLLVLSKIFFSSLRGPRPYWRNKARQKWMDMTPEERDRFKEEWGRRCGGPGAGRAPWSEGRQRSGGKSGRPRHSPMKISALRFNQSLTVGD